MLNPSAFIRSQISIVAELAPSGLGFSYASIQKAFLLCGFN